MIQFTNVSKIYNTNYALENVSFTIKDGEFVFLTGASGAGKTTVMKLLLRDIIADKGMVTVDKEDVSLLNHSNLPDYRKNLGVVFQDYKLLNKTVYNNIAFALMISEAPEDEIEERVNDMLDIVHLTDKANSYPWELSGGEQQRVTIARAIVNVPPILIADEPTGNLDEDNSIQILDLFEKINKMYNMTILMATHDEHLLKISDKRIIRLDKGHRVGAEENGKKVLEI